MPLSPIRNCSCYCCAVPKEILGLRLYQRQRARGVKCVVLGGGLPAVPGIASLAVNNGAQHMLPGARGQGGIAGGQVSFGDHQVYMRVVLGLITRVDHALGLALIGSLQALLPAGFDILDVVSTPASAEQT